MTKILPIKTQMGPEGMEVTIPRIDQGSLLHCIPPNYLESGVLSLDVSGEFLFVEACAQQISDYIVRTELFPNFDVIVSPASGGSTLAHEVAARLFYEDCYDYQSTIVVRSGQGPYDSLRTQYRSATTSTKKSLHLTERDKRFLFRERVLIIDDVYYNGGTMGACQELVEKAGGQVVASITIAVDEASYVIGNYYYMFLLPRLKEGKK